MSGTAEGWGGRLDPQVQLGDVRPLLDQIAALQAQVARLKGPVTDEEWDAIPKLMAGRRNYSSRDEVDALLRARAE